MAIFMRNVLHGHSSFPTSQFWMRFLVTFREIMLAGKWTEVYKTNATEWDANITLTLADAAVSGAAPLRITSPTGGFTGYAGQGITMLSSNDENRGVFRIAAVISDNELAIELGCAPPNGWTTETGISCRLFDWGNDDPLTNATILDMAPPSGTNELYTTFASGYYVDFFAYPDGYQAGAGHPTNIKEFIVSSNDKRCYFNAYFDGGPNALIYAFTENTNFIIIVGELDDVEVGDTYPGFLSVALNSFDPFLLNQLSDVNMIDSASPTTKLKYQPMALVDSGDKQASSAITTRYSYKLGTRLVNGKARLQKPWVYEGTTLGGFVRGRIPHYRLTNWNWEQFRPMDSARSWLHLKTGFAVPMNGGNDNVPTLDAS